MDLSFFKKTDTDDLTYQLEYLMIRNQYPSYMSSFTDGSKDDERVASAACCRGYTESESLPGPASVYNAEINSLLIWLEVMANSNKTRFLRLFVLHASIAQRGDQTLDEHTALAPLEFHIVFYWIPGHISIKGNDGKG